MERKHDYLGLMGQTAGSAPSTSAHGWRSGKDGGRQVREAVERLLTRSDEWKTHATPPTKEMLENGHHQHTINNDYVVAVQLR